MCLPHLRTILLTANFKQTSILTCDLPLTCLFLRPYLLDFAQLGLFFVLQPFGQTYLTHVFAELDVAASDWLAGR